jgi:glycosyltransferase involved in cell wall biosynthesis
MKLCFVTETLHAGVGRYVVDVSRALVARGHAVHVLYSPQRVDRDFERVVRTHAGLSSRAISMPRSVGAADIPALARLALYLKGHGPFDVIHAHSSKAGGYVRALAPWHRTPVVYSPHAFITLSPDLSSATRIAYRWIERGLAVATDRLICVSHHERRHAEERLRISPRRLATIVNGVAPFDMPTRAAARAAFGLSDSEVVVGFVGRMDAQKSPERLIAAIEPLFEASSRLRVVMIGDGAKRAPLERYLAREGWGERVRWLGAVDARRHLPAFDLLAASSLYEGFAYVLLEALHAGLPIVTTDVGGAIEAVEHGVNGFIVAQDQPGALTDALRRLIDSDSLRRSMAKASADRCSRFSLTATVDLLERHYLDLASRGREAVLPAPAVNEAARAETTG